MVRCVTGVVRGRAPRALRQIVPPKGRRLAANVIEVALGHDPVAEVAALTRRADRAESQADNVIRALVQRHYGSFKTPPPALRLNVGMIDTELNFWSKGIVSSGVAMQEFGTAPSFPVLDWGCGSGRTLYWLRCHPAWREHYYGCDVDADAIAWLQSEGEGQVDVCGAEPPLPYPDDTFGGLVSFSVLTHIHPRMHGPWYAELQRVLAPGGKAYITVLGDAVAAGMTADVRAGFARDGWAYVEREGHYKHTSMVTEAFSRAAFDGLFEVDRFVVGEYGNMDTFVLRKPG